ncbi:hypothetical protein [Nocardioides sp. Arc9.136]|uniref:hypothetical protein n=1 Tax=Nocardioides sp. Arc9.136 TaxID=2996826 RepID=UPI0026668661|nr:hypothetical protein [Nocardioides sp. Arc9.136]WKN47455.1 hypothetical protein OSR43_15615 [Nocardioides sp. Arc9.136]
MATLILGVRVLIGAAPAVLLVIGAVLLMLIALPMNGERRSYALLAVDRLANLAWVVVGLERPHPKSTA